MLYTKYYFYKNFMNMTVSEETLFLKYFHLYFFKHLFLLLLNLFFMYRKKYIYSLKEVFLIY